MSSGRLWDTPHPDPGMELGRDMEKEGGGLLVFFLSVDPSGPKPLGAREADPSLGLREQKMGSVGLPHLHLGLGVGVGVSSSWVEGP